MISLNLLCFRWRILIISILPPVSAQISSAPLTDSYADRCLHIPLQVLTRLADFFNVFRFFWLSGFCHYLGHLNGIRLIRV